MKLSELKRRVDELLASTEFDGKTDVDILHVTYTDEGEPDTLMYMDFQYIGVAKDRLVICNVEEDDLADALEEPSVEDEEEEETVGDLPFGTKGDDSNEDENPRQQEL